MSNIQDDSNLHQSLASSTSLSRRTFLARAALVSAATAVAPSLLLSPSRAHAGNVLPEIVIQQALEAVIAFVVPGQDPHSVQQGVTDSRPGGLDANAYLPLRFGLDQAAAAPAPFSSLSELIAVTLDQITPAVNPAPEGPFVSAFANLSFPEKAAVFSIMDSGVLDPALVPLANSLLVYTGLMVYSEAGFFDPSSGQLIADPVGWAISQYEGVSDGRKDYKGYFHGRRTARD